MTTTTSSIYQKFLKYIPERAVHSCFTFFGYTGKNLLVTTKFPS